MILNKVVEWQLDNPGSDKDACVAWLKEEQRSGRVNVEELIKSTSGAKRVQADGKEAQKRARRTP